MTDRMEPATRAGRVLWAGITTSDEDFERLLQGILAIEAEAAAPRETPDQRLREAERRIAAARFVGRTWIAEILRTDALRQTGMSHPAAMVLAALDGETDPKQVGLHPEYHNEFRALATEGEPPREAPDQRLDVERLWSVLAAGIQSRWFADDITTVDLQEMAAVIADAYAALATEGEPQALEPRRELDIPPGTSPKGGGRWERAPEPREL